MPKRSIPDNSPDEEPVPLNFRDLSNLTNGKLNLLLESYGLSTKGKRKHKLTVLASQLGFATTGSDDTDIDPFLQILHQVENMFDGWTKDIRGVPEIKLNYINDYLLAAHDITVRVDHGEYEAYTAESMKRYKALRSYDMWESGHIGDISFNGLAGIDEFSALKCKANPSGDTSGTQYDVIVVVKEDGTPVGASCSCVAGLGEACTHVAGLLFAMEDFVSRGYNSLPDEQATTERLCKWIVPRGTAVSPKAIKDVAVCKSVHGSKKKKKRFRANEFNPVAESKREVNFDDLAKLRHKLSLEYPAVPWVKAIAPAMIEKYRPADHQSTNTVHVGGAQLPNELMSDDPIIVPAREVEVKDKYEALTIKDKSQLFIASVDKENTSSPDPRKFTDSLKWSAQDHAAIEESTREQSRSTKWTLYRHGLLTSSNFQRIAGRVNVIQKGVQTEKGNKANINLVSGSRVMQQPVMVVWNAARQYERFMKENHSEYKLEKCGLYVHMEHGFLGASPDRIGCCSCHGRILAEIKCPKILQDGGTAAGMDYIEDCNGDLRLKTSHAYYAQVQGQMAVTGIHTLHFLVFNGQDCVIIELNFNKEYWNELYHKLYFFYVYFVAPQLLGTSSGMNTGLLPTGQRGVLKKSLISNVISITNQYPCGKCGHVLEEVDSLSDNTAASVACDCACGCGLWFHC